MRIKITLWPVQKHTTLPINYNSSLTGLIYAFIRASSRDYAGFLHDEGYRLIESKKEFKLFTYSMLRANNLRITGDRITFRQDDITWYISSPVNDFVRHLINGIFSKGQSIKLGPAGNQKEFIIKFVETVEKPAFTETMNFRCLAPITASKTIMAVDGGKSCHYFRPWEEQLSEFIRSNLVKKYRLLYGNEPPESGDFRFIVDEDYLKRKNGKVTKVINFKGTNIVGILAPFTVTGPPELIEIGYECGFGQKGSIGFGMADITEKKPDNGCLTAGAIHAGHD
jgi:CRISPR-associated endoribonuclease Cas6